MLDSEELRRARARSQATDPNDGNDPHDGNDPTD